MIERNHGKMLSGKCRENPSWRILFTKSYFYIGWPVLWVLERMLGFVEWFAILFLDGLGSIFSWIGDSLVGCVRWIGSVLERCRLRLGL